MKTHFPDALKVMPDYVKEFKENPTSPLGIVEEIYWEINHLHELVQIKVSPWNLQDRILLVGDSAHAMVPFYGQGMNAAFEDCLQFEETLDKYQDDISKAVPEFVQQR